MHFCAVAARVYGRLSKPRNTSLNWFIPALVNSSVGSSPGTTGEEATMAWPFDSKNFRKVERISAAFIPALSEGLARTSTWRVGGRRQGARDSRTGHLYRVQLSWLVDFDPRDGKTERYAERTGTGRATNALQFRVLEMAGPDGQRLSAARLGPKGQILADPPNIGIMSLLRALLVEWVSERHPDATVLTGSMYQVDKQSEDAMAVRDNFFARSGFTVKAIGDSGTFYAHSIRALKTSWNPDKATELTTPLIAEAVSAQMEAPGLHKQIAALQD